MATYWDERSPYEVVTQKGMIATRFIIGAWDDRFDIKAELLGWPPPMYPYDAYWRARVSEVELVEGFDNKTQNTEDASRYNWDQVRFRVTYMSPGMGNGQPYPVDSDPRHYDRNYAYEERMDSALSALRMDPAQFRWASDNAALKDGEEPFRMEYGSTYVIVRHGLSYIHTNMIDLAGYINSVQVNTLSLYDQTNTLLYFPVHTMFYEGCSVATVFGPDQRIRYDITLRFNYRAATWRKWWRADIQDYDSLRIAGTLDDYEWPPETDCSLFLP